MSQLVEYFTNLNSAGQALFIVGTLLIITFIILLIVVLKPEKKAHKVYSESEETDREEIFEKRLKDIDNISEKDINIDNDKTRNLKSIVDELNGFEKKEYSREEIIERYERDEEDTAVISLDELLGKPIASKKDSSVEERIARVEKERSISVKEEVVSKLEEKKDDFDDDFFIDDTPTREEMIIVSEKKPRREVFSSVFISEDNTNNDEYLKSLKDFRNNLN